MKQDQKREALAAALIEMLNDTPLESVRTADLCAKAHVSKSTFYRLFRDKYDLSFWIYQKHIDKIVLDTPDLSRWDEWTNQNFAHVLEHKVFYRNFATYRGQNSLYDSLALYFRGNILKYRKNKEQPITDDQKYAVNMFSLISAQAVIDWILGGFKESPEIHHHRVALCIPECIREFF